MNKDTLQKANELAQKIREHEQALYCFEYDHNYYARDENPDLEPDMRSTNPQLIIEHDDTEEWEGRTTTPIPMILSDYLIEAIKLSIKDSLKRLQTEFETL